MRILPKLGVGGVQTVNHEVKTTPRSSGVGVKRTRVELTQMRVYSQSRKGELREQTFLL